MCSKWTQYTEHSECIRRQSWNHQYYRTKPLSIKAHTKVVQSHCVHTCRPGVCVYVTLTPGDELTSGQSFTPVCPKCAATHSASVRGRGAWSSVTMSAHFSRDVGSLPVVWLTGASSVSDFTDFGFRKLALFFSEGLKWCALPSPKVGKSHKSIRKVETEVKQSYSPLNQTKTLQNYILSPLLREGNPSLTFSV